VTKKERLSGVTYYKAMGLTKSLVLYISPKTALGLSEIAKFEERSMQTVIRRAIEQFVSTRLKELEGKKDTD
jgi:predicted transcriptional regulator